MLFLSRNEELIKNREKTYLTVAVAVAGTTLTVRAVDAGGGTTTVWADNDYIILGEIGAKNAELLQLSATPSDGTSISIDQLGSGGARFAHAVDEPVYRIDFNRIEISRSSTDDSGASSVLATNEIQPDDLFTRFEDVTNTTGFGFVRWNNETTELFSEFSDGIPYTGYGPRTLGRIIKMIRRHLDEPDFRQIQDEDIIEEVNEKQRDISHERLWSFYEDTFSDSTVAFQDRYDIDNDVVLGKVHDLVVRSEPMAKVNITRFNILHWNTARTGEPTHSGVWDNQILLYPNPSSAAQTNAINDSGNITATVTTITADSTSGFDPSGRIVIDSEVISYTNLTSTSFRGCVRGLEETTAAIHLDNATITARDIIYTANREPNEILDSNDETSIPDPLVLVYGVSMELALGKLKDQGLHDRMKAKYDQSIERLRDKFGRKMTGTYYSIKDKKDVVTDQGIFRDPNQFPTNINI